MFPEIIAKNLENPKAWFGISITHEFPHMERLWLTTEDQRLCLHRILPIEGKHEPYFHRHPWSCETDILHGSYFMNLGFGLGPEPPPIACRLKLAAGSRYVMDNPLSWHTVEPLENPVFTIFKITHRWDTTSDSAGICRTRHDRLSRKRIVSLLEAFWEISKGNFPSLTS